MSRAPNAGALPLLAALGLACATPPVADIQPGERPAIETDEAGFWMVQDRVEAEVASSGRIVRDAALEAYLRGVTCRLASEYCPDLRIYVLDVSEFNAFMSPNGMMQIWTGLLLRVQNEAQLAAVLGHELAHYTKRHTLKRWRDAKRKADWVAVYEIALRAGGLEPGSEAQLLLIGSVNKFGRDQERESDRVGLELMARAGYDPAEASKVWQALIQELEAGDVSEPPIFFASHPPTAERIETLDALAAGWVGLEGASGRERFLEHVLPQRKRLLEGELRKRRFARTKVVLERLRAEGAAPGEIDFYLGELHRERDDPGDAQEALKHYRRALAGDGSPPQTWRSIGWVERRLGRDADAREAFRLYLEHAPEAEDRLLIEAWLARSP